MDVTLKKVELAQLDMNTIVNDQLLSSMNKCWQYPSKHSNYRRQNVVLFAQIIFHEFALPSRIM